MKPGRERFLISAPVPVPRSGDSPDPRCLYDPIEGTRSEHEWDDHGENFGRSYDGPDLWITVKATPGTQRISLYFANYDGQGELNADRDFLVELMEGSTDIYSKQPPPRVLAKARVKNFWGGVYKQFLVQGPGSYRLKISRQHGFNTMVAGVFVDRIKGPSTEFDSFPLAWLGGVKYDPPEITEIPHEGVAYDAMRLWLAVDDSCSTQNGSAELPSAKLLAYRAALSAPAPSSLLANWRWCRCLWSATDRRLFNQKMDEGWIAATKICQSMIWEKRAPLYQ